MPSVVSCLRRVESTGLLCGDTAYTFDELAQRCQLLAGLLHDEGVRPGDRVAYLSTNTHWLWEAYFGVPLAAAIFVPLNIRASEATLRHIVRETQPLLLLYEPEFAGAISCLEGCRCVCLDGEWEQRLGEANPIPLEIAEPLESQIAQIFYTSGTTGQPMGAAFTHDSLYRQAEALAATFSDVGNCVLLHSVPLFHANAWGLVHAATLAGIKQVMLRRFDAELALDLIERHRVTDISLVPHMARSLLTAARKRNAIATSLQHIQIGGAPCPPELLRQLADEFRCDVFIGYGLTEAGPVVALRGKPLHGVEVRLVSDEIVVASPWLMTGYWNRQPSTDAWLRTGDRGAFDNFGDLVVLDRMKDIIISGGENISAAMLEQAIDSHPSVIESAVLAMPDEEWGEVPLAIVVLNGASSAGQLILYLRGLVAGYELPKRVERSAEPLPRTATGKIRKDLLRERYKDILHTPD